jgi:hypothetical protein
MQVCIQHPAGNGDLRHGRNNTDTSHTIVSNQQSAHLFDHAPCCSHHALHVHVWRQLRQQLCAAPALLGDVLEKGPQHHEQEDASSNKLPRDTAAAETRRFKDNTQLPLWARLQARFHQGLEDAGMALQPQADDTWQGGNMQGSIIRGVLLTHAPAILTMTSRRITWVLR